MPNEKNPKYDLEERTASFGEKIIGFSQKIPQGPVNNPLINQLVRAGTSIGANYSEADDAETSRDFIHKLGICKKEARETKHWLRMMTKIAPNLKEEIIILWQEAKELNLIFNSIINKIRAKTR